MRQLAWKRASCMGKAVALMLVLCSFPLYSYAMETVILKVYLNTMDRGEHFLLLTRAGVILMPRGDLLEMGIKKLPHGGAVRVDGTEYMPVHALAPDITYEFDEKNAELRLTAAAELLEKNIIDLSPKRAYGVEFIKANSAFLNYNVTYSADNDFNLTSLNVPLELGLSIRGVLGLSTFSYTRTTTEDKLARLLTNITVDEPGKQRRYMAGDVSTPLGVLGGVSLSKNFSLTPFFVTSPTLTLQGVVDTPSDVSLYVDDRLVETRHLAPGKFEFRNIREASNRGETKIVIKDAFGREKEVIRSYYISSTLLKKGIHEYSYNFGFKREALGLEDFNYGGWALTAFHGLGITDSLTGKVHLEADSKVASLSTEAAFTLRSRGELASQASVRYGGGRTGYSGSLNYSYGGRGLGGGFSVSYFSRDFTTVGTEALVTVDSTRVNASLTLAYNQALLGSLSGIFSISDKWSGTGTRDISLHYSRRILQNATLFARASRTWTDVTENAVFVGINYSLGHEISGGVDYSRQGSTSSESAYITKNAPAGRGVGMRTFVDRNEDASGSGTLGGGAAGTYRGRYGVYTLDYRRTGGTNSYVLNASGGIAFINSSLFFSRPIHDSFALVKVGGLQGVSVSSSNQASGVTNKKGEIFVTGLTSYYDNRLSIDDQNIPVNYELKGVEKYVTTPLRGGGVVRFDVTKLQAFTGHFIIIKNGQKKAAEYWGFSMKIGDKKIRVIVGRGGEFYLENIPPGTWPARLFLKDKECVFDMTIPESDDMMIDMKEVSCEMD